MSSKRLNLRLNVTRIRLQVLRCSPLSMSERRCSKNIPRAKSPIGILRRLSQLGKKMKTLYSESEGERDQQEVELDGPSTSDPSKPRDGASGFEAVEEEVVVEDVVE